MRFTKEGIRALLAGVGVGGIVVVVLAHAVLGAQTAADSLKGRYQPAVFPGAHFSPAPVGRPPVRLPAAPGKPVGLPAAPVQGPVVLQNAPAGRPALPVPGGGRALPVPSRGPGQAARYGGGLAPPPVPAGAVSGRPHQPGSVPAAPAVLPPLPGNGRVVPPPPPLPSVGPVAPLAPATGAPMVEGPPPGTSSVRIYSDFVRYDRRSKQALAKGNVVIFQGDTTITTSEAHYDEANKITTILVPFQLVQVKPGEPKTTLKGDAMTVYHQQKHVVVAGDVNLVRAGQPDIKPANASTHAKLAAAFKRDDTVVDADHMDYYTNTKDAQFDGNVHFIQKEKNATADHAYLDNAKNTMTMDGNVVLTQIKGDWLSRNGLIDASTSDPERDAALKKKTVITGDHLIVNETTNDAVMTGQLVTVKQQGREATGQRAVYHDGQKTIVLTGNVRIAKEDGGYLTANRAVFHSNTDKFEAYGTEGHQVETDFSLPGS